MARGPLSGKTVLGAALTPNVSRPHLVGAVDLSATQKIGVDTVLAAFPPATGMRPGCEGLDAHELHEPPDPLRVHLVSLQAQNIRHHAHPQSGVLEVEFVHAAHQREIECAFSPGCVVEGVAADAEQLTLALNANISHPVFDRRTLLDYSPKALAFFWSHSSSTVN